MAQIKTLCAAQAAALLVTLTVTPMASAELEISGGANTIQARFEAFSACTRDADDSADSGEDQCADEAAALREMIGPRTLTVSQSEDGEAQNFNAGMKETVTE